MNIKKLEQDIVLAISCCCLLAVSLMQIPDPGMNVILTIVVLTVFSACLFAWLLTLKDRP